MFKSMAGRLFTFLMVSCLTLCIFSVTVFAAPDINDVIGEESGGGGTTSSESSGNHTIADGLADAFDQATVNNEDIANASKMTAPYVKMVNTVVSIVLGLFSTVLLVVTLLDLLYLTVPPIRRFLCPEQEMQGGSPMGGMGMGMMGGMRGMAPQGSSGSRLGRFISDEAKAAYAEATAQAGGSRMGGMGMGMGMGGMMGGMAQQKPSTKSVILTYAKKRIFMLIVFFACLVLFTSSLLPNIGLNLGQWIVNLVSGIFS